MGPSWLKVKPGSEGTGICICEQVRVILEAKGSQCFEMKEATQLLSRQLAGLAHAQRHMSRSGRDTRECLEGIRPVLRKG